MVFGQAVRFGHQTAAHESFRATVTVQRNLGRCFACSAQCEKGEKHQQTDISPGVFHLFIVADFGGSASFLEFFDEAVDVPVVREVDHDATAAVFRAFDADLLREEFFELLHQPRIRFCLASTCLA